MYNERVRTTYFTQIIEFVLILIIKSKSVFQVIQCCVKYSGQS